MMDIPNPRRILLVGQPDSPILDLLKDLTGIAPTLPDSESLAGTSHSLPLETAYYKVTVPIWVDVPGRPDPSSSGSDPEITTSIATTTEATPISGTIGVADSYTTWSSSFLSPSLEGASDVLASLGAFIVAFRKPSSKLDFDDIKSLLTEVGRVIAGCKAIVSKSGAGEWDGVCLAVGLRRAVVPGLNVTAEDFEDVCQGYGFEFVDGEVDVGKGRKRNEFGELQGIARLKEVLETNDWAANDEDDDFGLDDFGDLEDEESMGFGAEAAELEMEMFGMKRAIYEAGDEDGDQDGEEELRVEDDEDQRDEVEKLEALMLRMQAVRDMGADMPEEERKRFAAKAVKDIMKTL